jgi:hypothetical protein
MVRHDTSSADPRTPSDPPVWSDQPDELLDPAIAPSDDQPPDLAPVLSSGDEDVPEANQADSSSRKMGSSIVRSFE